MNLTTMRAMALLLVTGGLALEAAEGVQVHEGELVLPTYGVAPPDPVPRFY